MDDLALGLIVAYAFWVTWGRLANAERRIGALEENQGGSNDGNK